MMVFIEGCFLGMAPLSLKSLQPQRAESSDGVRGLRYSSPKDYPPFSQEFEPLSDKYITRSDLSLIQIFTFSTYLDRYFEEAEFRVCSTCESGCNGPRES